MSDETPPDTADTPEAEAPKKKTAGKRTRKQVKPAKVAKEAGPEAAAPAAEAAPESAGPPEAPAVASEAPPKVVRISERHVDAPPTRAEDKAGEPEPRREEGEGDAEPKPVISEPPAAEGQGGGGKRRRRRRRKGGQGEEGEGEGAPPPPPTRPKLDPSAVAKRAWKIYLSEVSEEGLALISDQDAKELTRRSFRLAEIFLEESARRQAPMD